MEDLNLTEKQSEAIFKARDLVEKYIDQSEFFQCLAFSECDNENSGEVVWIPKKEVLYFTERLVVDKSTIRVFAILNPESNLASKFKMLLLIGYHIDKYLEQVQQKNYQEYVNELENKKVTIGFKNQ